MGDKDCNKNIPRKWSELSYSGVQRVPPAEEPSTSSWPTYFIKRNSNGEFIDHNGYPIVWEIRDPNTFDFEGDQLAKVKATLNALTPDQITKAEYWNAGPPTKQLTPIIDRLIDTYGITATRAGRILAAVHGGINDAFVISWYFKYRWEVPRPNQLDQELATIVCTPHHPSYPAAHAVVSGCAETILSYFFAPETGRLKALAEECAQSRVYAGVHYPADIMEGLRLGRHIGRLIVSILEEQYDSNQVKIDYPITENRHANLMPPPYEQVIKFPRVRKCDSKLDPRQDPSAR
jgi:hypothetical protein